MKILSVLSVPFVLFFSGCASSPGGAFGTLQSTDDALAARYGVPVAAVAKVRSVLGIPDSRTLPDASRILPAGYVWYYDLYDFEGKVVDPASFHWGTFPKVKPASPVSTNVFSVVTQPAVSGTATLENLLQLLQANPSLLQPAK